MTSSRHCSTIFLDVRCLQDVSFSERGIGRHAQAILRHVPNRQDLRLIGLIDPDLPALSISVGRLFDDLLPSAYAAAADSEANYAANCYVALSPMTHDPLAHARLLASPDLLKAAVVHDFIPWRNPERYLADVADKLAYVTALRWLARADLFAPNSHTTARGLQALIEVDPDNVNVTGCAVDSAFEALCHLQSRPSSVHILVIGGSDPRKNPEVAIKAHARSRVLQEKNLTLVITGVYGGEELHQFRELIRSEGGREELVKTPGHIPQSALLNLYASARVVVCPSLDEGFSLPVVEAMAAGIPCLVSDIPAHRELVADPALRFGVDDPDDLANSLERLVEDNEWRNVVTTQQRDWWPRFQGREVGLRFWEPILRQLEARSALRGFKHSRTLHGSRPRVTLVSPLPPTPSGVADHTAAISLELAKLVDLTILTETQNPFPIEGVEICKNYGVLPHIDPDVDRVVSIVGNEPRYINTYKLLMRFGGACIAHDARMLGFYSALVGDAKTSKMASQELGRQVSEIEVKHWHANQGQIEALFLDEFLTRSSPLIVHSPITSRRLLKRCGQAPTLLPFCIYRSIPNERLTLEGRAEARRRLGIKKDEVVIATFGIVHSSKAPDVCITAVEILRRWGIDATLHFVGSSMHHHDKGASLLSMTKQMGISNHIRLPMQDFVPEQTYQDYLAGADLGIQLRTCDLGSISGALMDCAAAGLPTATNFSLAEALMISVSYVRTIPDTLSPDLLATELAELLKMGDTQERLECERLDFVRERSASNYAKKLCRLLKLEVET